MKTKNKVDLWQKAYAARHRAFKQSVCPYKKGTIEYDGWVTGYGDINSFLRIG